MEDKPAYTTGRRASDSLRVRPSGTNPFGTNAKARRSGIFSETGEKRDDESLAETPARKPWPLQKFSSATLAGFTGTFKQNAIANSLARSRGNSVASNWNEQDSQTDSESDGRKRQGEERDSLMGMLAFGDKGLHSVRRIKTGEIVEGGNCCNMCGDTVPEKETFTPCDCAFRLCAVCFNHVQKYENNRCPGCCSDLRTKEQWIILQSLIQETPHAHTPRAQRRESEIPSGMEEGIMAYTESKPHYGFGSVSWQQPPSQYPDRPLPSVDMTKKALTRKLKFSGAALGPYRIIVFIRFCAMVGFLQFRVSTPTDTGYWLWLMSIICELWFALSWILDTIPKLTPIKRETYRDRLKAVYDDGGHALPVVDVFITTADAQKEPPLTTANTILSVLACNYPPEKLAVYLSDDGASKLMFDVVAETAGFARMWVPFCKRHQIEPRCPEQYFTLTIDYLKGRIHPDFVKNRRKVKREYEEFKVRVNALVAESRRPPQEGWTMDDGSPWPGNNRRNHDGIIQVFLHPDGDIRDVEGGMLSPLIYISREKRPGHDHNKKAGAMNALLRASALISNGEFLLNLDCDHYVNNAESVRDALCFFLDPIKGYKIGFVQFPQRFDGIDTNDRYANRNTVFFDINMKGLDGQQGPVYVGTGCFFRRKAMYGFYPPGNPGKKSVQKHRASWWRRSSIKVNPIDEDGTALIDQKMPARLGACARFNDTVLPDAAFTMDEDQPVSPRTMLSDVVLVISCDYETNTDWGREAGWMYGSVTEDILSGMKIHTRGWRSAYCDPDLAAFKGSAPLNMTDRLQQVERWATGAVEIFFSHWNPLWSNWGTRLKLRQRLAYANNAFYPFTSVAIFMYCMLPPLALLTDYFFVPTLGLYAVIWFAVLIISFLLSSIMELKWSGVSFEAWWRNEQFWVIAGISSHLAAVVQGLLKVIAGLEISFTLTSKGGDDGDQDELHTFKFSWLLLPGIFVGLFNITGIIVGVARAATSQDSQDWVKLGGKMVFSFWVLIHLYPFAKGLMGKRNRAPTIVVVWAVLLVVTVALLWTNLIGG